MNRSVWIALVVVLSLPAVAQTAPKDRNLAATRRHANTTTLPPEVNNRQSGAKDTNLQLDKLERQTANTVISPAAKSAKAPAYKLPAEHHAATGSSYEQTMPVHAAAKNGTVSTNHSSRSVSVKPYKR